MTFNELQGEGNKVYRIEKNGNVEELYVSGVDHERRIVYVFGEQTFRILEDQDWYSSVGFGIDNNSNKFLYCVSDKLESRSHEVCEYWGDARLNSNTPLFCRSIIVTPSSINFKDDLFHIKLENVFTKEGAVDLFFSTEINGRREKIIKTSVPDEDMTNPRIFIRTVAKVNDNTEYHLAALTPKCLNRAVIMILKEVLNSNLDKINQLEKFAIKIQSRIDNFGELGELSYEDISKFD